MTPPRLLINADDYGYFPEVSQGVLDTARAGVVRATGILANGPHLEAGLRDLAAVPDLDLGVHLNLSHGRPLSPVLAEYLGPWGGALPEQWGAIRALLTGAIPRDAAIAEFRAQIERCLGLGLQLRFLNSHQHLHMLPGLCPAVLGLAREYGIGQVRRVQAEWSGWAPAALARTLALWAAERPQRRRFSGTEPRFLGLAGSGRLDLELLRSLVGRLRPGQTYELMCHPGRSPAATAVDPRLRAYHDWEGERQALLSAEFRALLTAAGVQLVGYRDLAPASGH